MALSALDRLRLLLADPLPTDGSDPMFSDTVLQDLLADSGNDPERAAAEGWVMKAAKYAHMVDVTEGNASRAMSDLHGHALDMVKQFQRSSTGPTEGRTRIGSIRRRR